MKILFFIFLSFALAVTTSSKLFAQSGVKVSPYSSYISLQAGGEFSVINPSHETVSFGGNSVTLNYKDYNRPILGFEFGKSAFSFLASWSNQDDVNYYFFNPRYSTKIMNLGNFAILGNVGPSIRIGSGSTNQSSYASYQFGLRFGMTAEMNITDTAFVAISPINLGYEFETYQKYKISGVEVQSLSGWKSLSWLTYSVSLGAGLRF
jgi:hypothetical protein